jgi:hypothetical protein
MLPILNLDDDDGVLVYSSILPQNLRTTDPLISALANYVKGQQKLHASFAEMQANATLAGYPDVSRAFRGHRKRVLLKYCTVLS